MPIRNGPFFLNLFTKKGCEQKNDHTEKGNYKPVNFLKTKERKS